MSASDPHHHHPHPAPGAAPEPAPVDSGSRALEDALRSSFVVVKAVMLVLLLVFLFSGGKVVGPGEQAVILRFGKPLGTGPEQLLGPGYHWAFPYPIDEVVAIKVGEVQTLTSSIGWYSENTPDAPAVPTLNPAAEGYLLTADQNIVHARATLRYRITDPLAYVFGFIHATNAVQNLLDNALLYAGARASVNTALINNAAFTDLVLTRLNEQIMNCKMGITVQLINVDVIAPGYVKPDFDAVLSAEQARSALVHAAQGYAESTVRAAESESNALVNAAEGYRTRLVADVHADANAFTNQLPQYVLNPELIRQRLLIAQWQTIFSGKADKWFMPEPAAGQPSELWLQLNREPQGTRNDTNNATAGQ